LKTGPPDPIGWVSPITGRFKGIFGGKTKEKGKGFEVVKSARAPSQGWITPSERSSSAQDSYHDAEGEHYHDDEEPNRNVQSEDVNKQSDRQDPELEGGTGPYTDSELQASRIPAIARPTAVVGRNLSPWGKVKQACCKLIEPSVPPGTRRVRWTCCCGDFLCDDYSAMWHEILNNCRKNWIDSFEDGRTVVAIVESLGLLSEPWVSHDKPSTMFKGACRKYLLI
jgi:hypothetical protein